MPKKTKILAIDYQHIQDCNSSRFQEAMAIYNEAFPSSERQSMVTVIERVKSGQSQLFVGIVKEQVDAMALLWGFKKSPFVLLDYLAIKNNYRGLEFGTQFFQFLVQMTIKNKQFLLLEAEHFQFGSNKEQRKKRIQFYIRNGAYLLSNVTYILPSLDGTASTEMVLMIAPKPPREIVEKESIKNLIQRLYLEIYEKEPNDSVLISLLDKIPEQIILTNTPLL